MENQALDIHQSSNLGLKTRNPFKLKDYVNQTKLVCVHTDFCLGEKAFDVGS